MPEVILPCPACGCDRVDTHTPEGDTRLIYISPNAYVSCDDCDCRGPLCSNDHAAIAAWNALPRMSTIIAWQFQASGAALALQRIVDAAQHMREAQQAYEEYGSNEDSATEAEAVFDGLLADVRMNLEEK